MSKEMYGGTPQLDIYKGLTLDTVLSPCSLHLTGSRSTWLLEVPARWLCLGTVSPWRHKCQCWLIPTEQQPTGMQLVMAIVSHNVDEMNWEICPRDNGVQKVIPSPQVLERVKSEKCEAGTLTWWAERCRWGACGDVCLSRTGMLPKCCAGCQTCWSGPGCSTPPDRLMPHGCLETCSTEGANRWRSSDKQENTSHL